MNSTSAPKAEEQFQSLLDTVERLRRERFPQIDAGLLRELLRLHADGGAADSELSRGSEQVVEQHLAKGG